MLASQLPIAKYPFGALIELIGLFRRVDSGQAANPDIAQVTVTPPDGVEVTHSFTVASPAPPIVHPSTGYFTMNQSGNQRGVWAYRWFSPEGDNVQASTFTLYFEVL